MVTRKKISADAQRELVEVVQAIEERETYRMLSAEMQRIAMEIAYEVADIRDYALLPEAELLDASLPEHRAMFPSLPASEPLVGRYLEFQTELSARKSPVDAHEVALFSLRNGITLRRAQIRTAVRLRLSSGPAVNLAEDPIFLATTELAEKISHVLYLHRRANVKQGGRPETH